MGKGLTMNFVILDICQKFTKILGESGEHPDYNNERVFGNIYSSCII